MQREKVLEWRPCRRFCIQARNRVERWKINFFRRRCLSVISDWEEPGKDLERKTSRWFGLSFGFKHLALVGQSKLCNWLGYGAGVWHWISSSLTNILRFRHSHTHRPTDIHRHHVRVLAHISSRRQNLPADLWGDEQFDQQAEQPVRKLQVSCARFEGKRRSGVTLLVTFLVTWWCTWPEPDLTCSCPTTVEPQLVSTRMLRQYGELPPLLTILELSCKIPWLIFPHFRSEPWISWWACLTIWASWTRMSRQCVVSYPNTWVRSSRTPETSWRKICWQTTVSPSLSHCPAYPRLIRHASHFY